MTEKAQILKKKLEQFFADITQEYKSRADLTCGEVEMTAEIAKAIDDVEEWIRESIQGSLDPELCYSLPEKKDIDNLRVALSYIPYVKFESWHVKEDITEKELLSAEKDIVDCRSEKLEALRDPKLRMDVLMPLADNYHKYMRLLNNIVYLLWIYANQSKHYNSFDAARCFLRAISFVNVRRKWAFPHFKEPDVETLAGYVQDGADELKIAVDYSRMKDWSSFREEESKSIAAEMKKLDEANRKDGK